MAAKKNSRAKTRKITRAKAAKKTSVRSGRKAPGRLTTGLGGVPQVINIE